jgi:hypothetical protein
VSGLEDRAGAALDPRVRGVRDREEQPVPAGRQVVGKKLRENGVRPFCFVRKRCQTLLLSTFSVDSTIGSYWAILS